MAGLAAAISRALLGHNVYLRENRVTVATTATRVLLSDPDRIAFLVENESAATIRWRRDGTVTSTTGGWLAAAGGFLSTTVAEHGETTGWELWAASTGAGTEVLYTLEWIAHDRAE